MKDWEQGGLGMKEVLEEIGVKIEWNEYKECAMSNIRQITVSHGEIIEDITIPKKDFCYEMTMRVWIISIIKERRNYERI